MKTKPLVASAIILAAAVAAQAASPGPFGSTVLGIQGGEFVLNGEPTFLLGFSYYGALGAHKAVVRRDLDDAQRLGFNWLRVWATWNAFDHDVSAVAADGAPRELFLGKLRWLVADCDQRGLVVDVTLTRGEMLSNFAAHQRAVETLVEALKTHRNWYLDLANEHDVHDARYVSDAELKRLRDLVRRLDSPRLVTASCGGHDLTFLNDLQGARSGGAAGWCFHNGQQWDTADKQPRRSFDLRNGRLFDQLDAVEQKVVQQAAAGLKGGREAR